MNRYLLSIIGITLLFGMLVTACGSKTDGPEIMVENAWGRPSPKIATAGAFYMLINNDGNEGDKLLSAESSACGVIELHESFQMEDGVMGMRPVEGGSIDIPAKGEIELKMGGLHIMCIDKIEDFVPGAILPVTLNFAITGKMDIDVEIREQ